MTTIYSSSIFGSLIAFTTLQLNTRSEPVTATTVAVVAAGIAGAELFRQTIVDGRGEISINTDLWKYERTISTSYKGVDIQQSWISEAAQDGKTVRYKYTCYSPQFTDQKTIINTNEFELIVAGSRLYGSVPLEVRNYNCTYSAPQGDGSVAEYSFKNTTKFQFKTQIKYIKTPFFPNNTYTVQAMLNNWTREQSNCHPISTYPYSFAYFTEPVPINGTGYIKVESRKMDSYIINLSSGDGAGVGFNIK